MPQNPLNLLLPSASEFSPERGKTALLVIDMQYLDAHPDWGLGRMGKEKGLEREMAYYFQQVAKIIPNIQLLLASSRRAGIEIIYSVVAALTKDCRDMSPALWARNLICSKDSKDAQILEELRPEGDEIVIAKTSSGIFNSTAIDQILKNLGIEYLIVVGVVTNACVELSARDAADRGYKVFVVNNATATFSEELQKDALGRLNTGLMKVKSTQDMLRLIAPLATERLTA